jgi:peptidyl-prolyl cis-trans isomerase B (cyclophilin B)
MKIGTLLLTVALFIGISFNAQSQGTKPVAKKLSSGTAQKQPSKPIASKPSAVSESPYTRGSVKIKITTPMGVIVVKLYDSTPKHRDNFVKLVQQKFYDSLLFHRIISGFMIQGGDPMSKNAAPGTMLGMGGGDMTRIPAEFNRNLIHKKGALCAARDGNPERASSACQFYLVQGKPVSEAELFNMEQGSGNSYTQAQRETYKTKGGTPFLDMNYTVFGETISGMDVIDKIATVKTDGNNRPLMNVIRSMEIIK